MPTLEKIINEKLTRLESVPDHLITRTAKSQEAVLKSLLKDLQLLDMEGGKILLNKKNLTQIDVIGNKLQNVLFEGEYVEAVKEFAGEFPKQAAINKQFFEKAFGSFTDDEIYQSVLQASQKTAIDKLSNTAIDANFINPLKAELNRAVTGKAGIAETADVLRQFVIGGIKDGQPIDGRLERYVKQVSRDGYSVSDREYTMAISDDLEIEFYQYSGGTVQDTRCFCDERQGHYFHRREIEDWGRRPELWAKKGKCKGGGRADGTNEQTIFTLLGGYNCLHSLIPVPIEAVPPEEIQRAKDLGYYYKEGEEPKIKEPK